MAQFLGGFGNGSDGVATLSGVDAPTDSSCSGTAGTRTLTVSAGLAFASGNIVMIHQTRGTGAGNWEIGQVDSYSGTTLTLKFNLVNTYTDSGASQAQVLVLKQYSKVTISGTLTPKLWDGNTGGILAFLCSGITTITGTINANGTGFRGGIHNATESSTATQGEASIGNGTTSNAANGMGGGGATKVLGSNGAGGGGGGHSASGSTAPNQGVGPSLGGTGGGTGGNADLTTMLFGGGGGGATGQGNSGTKGDGGTSGGIVLGIGVTFTITGSITANGNTGNSANSVTEGSGGSGGGGSVLLKARTVTLGTSLITATGGVANTTGGDGGAGGTGRIAIEACARTGTTNPAATEVIGGNAWCGEGAAGLL